MINRLLFCSALLTVTAAQGAETPMLALPGAVIYESKLDSTPAAHGKWPKANGRESKERSKDPNYQKINTER
jgi:hypothetical protein